MSNNLYFDSLNYDRNIDLPLTGVLQETVLHVRDALQSFISLAET